MNLNDIPQYKSKDSTNNIDEFFKNEPELLRNTITLSNFLNEGTMDKDAAQLTENQDFITEFAHNNEISEYEMENLLEGKTQYWRL